ncbi:MAG TPA: hypothetical protein VK638_03805 [Edaphobacter sp.]|jgi:hypothetical protein|nr:hypothetical protein [Edaphobacter sp.]
MKGNPAIYYWVYPLLLMAMTLLLTRMLYRLGAAAGTQRRSEDADPINRRLIIGLLTVAAGYLALTLLTNNYVATTRQMIDEVLIRLGFGAMLLGTIFTFDLLVLAVWRRGGRPRLARSSELV